MISRTPDEIASIELAARNQRFVEFIQRWRNSELERLPKQMVNPSLFQGRAQVLMELYDILNPAAAKQPTKT